MEGKKKRGSNYTASEKDLLLQLVKKHVLILENKKTDAQMVAKKRYTWNLICQQYNAYAVSGLRTWQQLRHLYENHKQRTKRNALKPKKCTCNKTLNGQNEQILDVTSQHESLVDLDDDSSIQFGDAESNETQNYEETSENLIINYEDLEVEDRKKRGLNYTAFEKGLVLQLVKKYEHILDNKKIDAPTIIKKRDTWVAICKQYNALASSGLRTWQQLRHLYENYKHKLKKNAAKSQKDSMQIKIERISDESEESTLEEQNQVDVSSEHEPAVEELDDAALYVDTTMGNVTTKDCIITGTKSSKFIGVDHKVSVDMDMENNAKTPSTVTSDSEDDHDDDDNKPAGNFKECDKFPTITCDLKRNTKTLDKKICNKQKYFKLKIKNANLESKYLINKNNMEINKYRMEMKILRLRLKKLKLLRQRRVNS